MSSRDRTSRTLISSSSERELASAPAGSIPPCASTTTFGGSRSTSRICSLSSQTRNSTPRRCGTWAAPPSRTSTRTSTLRCLAGGIPTNIGYTRDARRFTGEEGSPLYDYATFTIPVTRRTAFHMLKYFLPLFLIVVVGFSVFWIEPDDLNTQVSIGVTCLLAAIAFQYAESSSLPEVSHLTLADRVYVACYLAIVATMLESVYTHSSAKKGNHRKAVHLERRARIVFPTALALAVVVSVALSYRR